MNGFDRLKEQMVGQKNTALIETVNYLLTRNDMENKYLNEEKNIADMCDFIRSKANKHMQDHWTFFQNDVVFSWAIMYFNFPNEVLGINKNNTKNIKSTKNVKKSNTKNDTKDNVVSMADAKKILEDKKEKEVTQLSFFGGVT